MQPGTPAPSFTAPAYSSFVKEMVNVDLARLHGKYTVLFFYPGDFGPLVLADMNGMLEADSELMKDEGGWLAGAALHPGGGQDREHLQEVPGL